MKIIKLTQNKVALVDDEDFCLVSRYKWHVAISSHNYEEYDSIWHYPIYAKSCTYKDGNQGVIYMHRLIMNAQKGQIVDHIDRNGLNNTRSNLRFATNSLNLANLAKHSINKSSIFKGVHRKGQMWRASVTKDGIKFCKAKFKPKRIDQVFCSGICRKAYHKQAVEMGSAAIKILHNPNIPQGEIS